jgi:hypothetical protein
VLTERELNDLIARCRAIPISANEYLATDLVPTLLETVIDYQQNTATVNRAMGHFETEHAGEIRTFDGLEACLARFPDDRDGNVALARYLWGYRLWTRAEQLRGLVAYLGSRGITTMDALRGWARTSTFEDFRGQVRGLGVAVYQAFLMRLGVDTVKPDVHVMRFVRDAIGRNVDAADVIAGLSAAADALGVPASRLDWSIWEYQRTTPPSA